MCNFRTLFWLLIVLALTAAILGGVSALHKSFLESSASSSADFLASEFIDTSSLSADQVRRLERNLKVIKGGERYLKGLHSRLWRIATFGFAGLAVGCLGCAVLVFKVGRHQSNKNAG